MYRLPSCRCSQENRVWIQILVLLIVGTMTGCESGDSAYRDVRATRIRAYEEWKNARENGNNAKPLLKGQLSLQDALKVSLSYNKSLQAALQEKEISRGMIQESYAEVLPTISGNMDYTRKDEVGGFEIGGRSITIGDVDNYSVGLQVTQPLFRAGAASAIRAAKLYALSANEQVRGTVQAVIYDVAKGYYDTLLAQHLYTVNSGAVESAKAHLNSVQVKRNQGVASDFDVLRAQVDVSNFEAEMIQQRNRIHLAKAQLLKTLGASQSSEIMLSDSLEYAAMKPVLDEAVRLAYENRPDLYQADLNVRIQREALAVANSNYWPKIDAWFRQDWAKPDPHVPMYIEWGNAWTAGVSATLPLFDGFRREGRIVQERERLKQREIQLIDAEDRTLLEIQQAIFSVLDAEEFVASQAMNLDRAKEALRLAEVGYRQGIQETVAVTEARSALTRAQGLYYQAVYTHSLARVTLQKAMGILGPRAGAPTPVFRQEDTGVQIRPGEIEEFPTGTAGSLPDRGDEGDR